MSARNLFDCGITVVGHNLKAAPGGVPAPSVAGVYDNLVADNSIAGNGTKGEGAGVVLATALPGGAVYGNTVERNTITGDHFGIWTTGPATVRHAANVFLGVAVPVAHG